MIVALQPLEGANHYHELRKGQARHPFTSTIDKAYKFCGLTDGRPFPMPDGLILWVYTGLEPEAKMEKSRLKLDRKAGVAHG